MAGHTHTPELREARHYDQAVIRADTWVCAECETFLGWASEQTTT